MRFDDTISQSSEGKKGAITYTCVGDVSNTAFYQSNPGKQIFTTDSIRGATCLNAEHNLSIMDWQAAIYSSGLATIVCH